MLEVDRFEKLSQEFVKLQSENSTFLYFIYPLVVGRLTCDLSEDEMALVNMLYAKKLITLDKVNTYNYRVKRV